MTSIKYLLWFLNMMSIPRDSSSSMCSRCGREEVRGPLVTLQSWVTESHVGEPSQSAAQSAAGTSGACEALGHKQEGSSMLS